MTDLMHYRSPVQAAGLQPEPASLPDLLERILDKGLIIAGDIQVNLLDIELLTIKLRLLVASVERAREMGIDWWAHDPFLTSGSASGPASADAENRRLQERVAALERALGQAAAGQVDLGG